MGTNHGQQARGESKFSMEVKYMYRKSTFCFLQVKLVTDVDVVL